MIRFDQRYIGPDGAGPSLSEGAVGEGAALSGAAASPARRPAAGIASGPRGEEGAALQEQLREAALRNRLPILGPNVEGFVNYVSEWWHFSFTVSDPAPYDIPLEQWRSR